MFYRCGDVPWRMAQAYNARLLHFLPRRISSFFFSRYHRACAPYRAATPFTMFSSHAGIGDDRRMMKEYRESSGLRGAPFARRVAQHSAPTRAAGKSSIERKVVGSRRVAGVS